MCQVGILATEYVEKECSNVALTVILIIIELHMDIENVGIDALEDGINAMGPVLKDILLVEKKLAGYKCHNTV